MPGKNSTLRIKDGEEGRSMMRNLRRFVLPTALAAVIAGLLIIQPWGQEEAAGKSYEFRVCNVVVQHPPKPPIVDPNRFPQQGVFDIAATTLGDGFLQLAMRVGTDKVPQAAVIDGKTGQIIREENKELVKEILNTMRVEPIDPASAPWPYTEATQVPIKRFKEGDIEYRLPDPGAGLVSSVIFTNPAEEPIPEDLSYTVLHNCRSQMWIGQQTGQVLEARTDIYPEDKAAFETFLGEITVMEK